MMSAQEVASTTVVWPVRIELDLIQAAYLPSEQGMPAIGSGASAKLVGRIMGPDDRGARAEIRFLAGANEGRVLHTDITGAFGASDLYPGLSVVEVRGAGILGSRRELRLRQERETLLNIGYGRPGSVTGRVQDRQGEGLADAAVTVDGTRVTTGPDGEFSLASVASGQVLVEVEHEGYAAYQELVWVAGGRSNPKDRMTFTLQPATSMVIAITENAGGPGPVQLILLPGQAGRRVHPESAHRNMRYPWHRINPVEVWPSSTTRIDGLPAEAVRVYAFRPGAQATMRVVNLRPNRPATVRFQLEPASSITGRITHQGEPVRGAVVHLEAPNRVRATLAYFRQGSHYLETAVMPSLPPAIQQVETGADGRFVLTAWADQSPTRYLEARGPDGRTWAGRLVQPDERTVDLELREVDLGDSTLVVDFPERWQGLPLEILVEGSPQDPGILPPDQKLQLGDLLAGSWHLKMSWHSTPIREETLTIEGVTDVRVPLPPECIDGQDEEVWRRAGREYPRGSS